MFARCAPLCVGRPAARMTTSARARANHVGTTTETGRTALALAPVANKIARKPPRVAPAATPPQPGTQQMRRAGGIC
eukprot:5071847-Prymnesium_polylepis.1